MSEHSCIDLVFLYACFVEQIFLFTGENTFALRSELQRWTHSFAQKHGDENLSRLDARHLTLSKLLDEIAVAPFIAEKRLVLVQGLPLLEKEEVERIAIEIHPAVLLVFREEKPDKRTSAAKAFLKLCTIKEFAPLPPAALKTWMKTFASECGSSFSDQAITTLIETVGDQQDLLATEIRKICVYAGDRTVTKQDVETMVLCMGERASWRMIELLGQGKADQALVFAKDLLDRGESAYALWNRLLWMVESLALIAVAVREGTSSSATLSKTLGLGYGTVNALLPLARGIAPDQLARIVSTLAQADVSLKTGGYKATTEAPDELLALIDSTIIHLG